MAERIDIAIPEGLLAQIEDGNGLLFVGERIARDPSGIIVPDRLIGALAARLGGAADEKDSLPELAQDYEQRYGRTALVRFVRDELEALGDEPQDAHILIALLTQFSVLVTTALNHHLERAFHAAGRRLQVGPHVASPCKNRQHDSTTARCPGVLRGAEPPDRRCHKYTSHHA
jgi:hypothetical protein